MTLHPPSLHDTIAAVASGTGGAIGVVRIAGADTERLLAELLRTPAGDRLALPFRERRLSLARFVDAAGDLLDEGLFAFYRGPRSYTGEDGAELFAHGGAATLRAILARILALGARAATPGEFTKRAYAHGRIDRAAANAILALSRARDEATRAAAARQITGGAGRALGALFEEIVSLRAELEAFLDFPDDDLDATLGERTADRLAGPLERARGLAARVRAGALLRDGTAVVVVGRPNVGKSSLFNRLLGADRAIVTAIPGTTRDLLTEAVSMGGTPVILHDTAGVRETADPVETQGVARTRDAIERSILLLVVLDGSEPLEDADIALLDHVRDRTRIVLLNKSDRPPAFSARELETHLEKGEVGDEGSLLSVSALDGTGVDALEAEIERRLSKIARTEAILLDADAEAAVVEAAARLEAAWKGARDGLPLDLTLSDLRLAQESLHPVVHEIDDEALLDRIFSRFCIGK